MRLYTKDTVMVYEGAYMKVMGLLHRVDPWLSGKYRGEAVELQIVYGYAFGKREGKYYGQAGVSYFIAAVDNKNETFVERGKKFVNKLIGLEKGNKFNVEDYFKPSAANLVIISLFRPITCTSIMFPLIIWRPFCLWPPIRANLAREPYGFYIEMSWKLT